MTNEEQKLLDKLNELTSAGDNLALACARVCADYDGIHRLRAALAVWYDLRAGIHGSRAAKKEAAL